MPGLTLKIESGLLMVRVVQGNKKVDKRDKNRNSIFLRSEPMLGVAVSTNKKGSGNPWVCTVKPLNIFGRLTIIHTRLIKLFDYSL